jgi:hypothetical protein
MRNSQTTQEQEMTVTCVSEPPGVTCTDGSTGHFFRIAGVLSVGLTVEHHSSTKDIRHENL